MSKGSDLTCNKLQYTLLGDPALHLATPQQEIVVDSINGLPADEGIKLAAGSVVRVSGHIIQDNDVDTSFNGVVTLTVRDAEETITCRQNDQTETDEIPTVAD